MAELQLPSIDDFADAEHCVLEDVTEQVQALGEVDSFSSPEAREISVEHEIRDGVRGRVNRIRLYAEGWADIEVESRAHPETHERFNMRYLDPTPETSHHCPVLLLKIAGALAALTGISAICAAFGLLAPYTVYSAIACGAAMLASLVTVYYRTHQLFVFKTLHGRADALRLVAGLGTGFRVKKALPALTQSIAEFSGTGYDDVATYLRAEMHEHYRLRNEGIIDVDQCASATGKLLNKFDEPK